MVGTQEHINEIVWRYYMPRKFYVCILTTKCPVGCRHCMRQCTMENIVEQPDEYNRLAIEGMPADWLLGVSGGEPVLNPTLLRKTVERGRKNGEQIAMATSGYWVDDPAICELVLDELKLDYIVMSVDAFHEEKIPIKKLNAFAERTNHKKTIVIGNLMISKLPTPKAVFASLPFPLIACGRATSLTQHVTQLVGEFAQCESPGVIVETNGNIFGGCYAHMGSCTLGHVTKGSPHDFVKRCGRPRFLLKNGVVVSTSEVCKKTGNHIYDEKWRDPSYYEEIDLKTWKVTPQHGPAGNELDAILEMPIEELRKSDLWNGWRSTYKYFL